MDELNYGENGRWRPEMKAYLAENRYKYGNKNWGFTTEQKAKE